MPDDDHAGSADELILTHLLCWNELPFETQARILDQADDIIGLRPIPDARRRIVELLLRHGKI